MEVTLYGLKACDTCKKAAKAITAAGQGVNFIDVRETPLAEQDLARFWETFGDKLVNTRSTTWRGLNDVERAELPLGLLMAHPTLMKRPVLESAARLTLGWDKSVQAIWLV